LKSGLQHKLLRERAAEIVRDWDFPQHLLVRRLAQGIAAECLAKSLEGNASLGGGANSFGIPQDEFDAITQTNPLLANALKFGVAYNAFVLVPNHGTKKRRWCLVELGGGRCHVAMRKARAVYALRIFKPPRRPRATWSSPRRVARGVI